MKVKKRKIKVVRGKYEFFAQRCKELRFIIWIFVLTSCQVQKIQLGLNLKQGNRYIQKMNNSISMQQRFGGQEATMIMKLNSVTEFKVTNVHDTFYDMDVIPAHISMKMGLPGRETEFSSEKNDEKDYFSKFLGIMKKSVYQIKMSKKGKVNEVSNLESIITNSINMLPPLPELQRKQIMGQLMHSFGEKAFKGNLEMYMAIFPDSFVKKGDKWVIKTQLESGMAAKMETVYELKKITRTYYQIVGNSTLETIDKDAYVETNGMPMKYDLVGTMTSDIKVDRKSRWIKSALVNSDEKGTASIKENPQLPDGLSMPMRIINKVIITEKK